MYFSALFFLQVLELELITAAGDIITCSSTENTDLFRAAACSLGALGVITAVKFQCEPAFRLISWPATLDEVRIFQFDIIFVISKKCVIFNYADVEILAVLKFLKKKTKFIELWHCSHVRGANPEVSAQIQSLWLVISFSIWNNDWNG